MDTAATTVEEFLYDDYFSDEGSRGVDVRIQHRGHTLLFRMRKSLTLAERQRASDQAISISIDKDSKPHIDRMDQAAFTKEIVLAAVKAWPFTYPDGGPVPINRKTVAALDSALCDKLSALALGMEEQQEKARVPFVPKSDED